MQLELDAAGRRQRHTQEMALWQAWHIALLNRAEKLPKLKTLMDGLRDRAVSYRTWEDQLRLVKMINTAWGGNDLRQEGTADD